MCGICGIYHFEANNKVKIETIKHMAETLEHRGPDDEGFYFDGNIGLGHKRLSIIDLSQSAHQPMTNEIGTIWLTYNGEIYNYLELKKELLKKGHVFKSNSDSEVIIHLYEEDGEQCLQKLNGMFAFAIWDRKKRKLFAARDRLGIKPFYYYYNDHLFTFASEIKALLKCGINASANPAAINDYLAFQFCIGEKTFFKEIKKLLPGHCLTIRHKKIKITKYWDLNYRLQTDCTEKHFQEKLLYLLNDALKLQVRSDVPLGAHLSGGIDSSTIVCIAAKLLKSVGLKTFTGAFKEGALYDETKYAKQVADFNGVKNFVTYPTPRDFINDLPKLIYLMDEPAAGPGLFPQYQVAKLAARQVKVILGGQGGDEVWGGYTRYLIAYLEQVLKGAILNKCEEKKFVVDFKSILPNLGILREYIPLLQAFWAKGIFGERDERYYRLITRMDDKKNLFTGDFLNSLHATSSPFTEFRELFNRPDTLSYINKMTYVDIKTLLPALLQIEDRTSMAVSLESRVPLLDHRLVELSAQVPPTIKYKGGASKYLFKKTVKKYLPKSIIQRKDKIGFAVPLNEWYRHTEVKEFVRSILLDKKARDRRIYQPKKISQLLESEVPFGRSIWGLLCLELWYRTFI